MKRWFLVLAFLSLPAFADDSLLDPKQEARAVLIGEELRCVVCQSESINSSQADMARDMRLLVRDKIMQGWSDQQILDFAQARYGDFILLKPPIQANTYILWALPFLFLVVAFCIVKALFARKTYKI
jgi:cytochrome c-type biogenesis protein CcmH